MKTVIRRVERRKMEQKKEEKVLREGWKEDCTHERFVGRYFAQVLLGKRKR